MEWVTHVSALRSHKVGLGRRTLAFVVSCPLRGFYAIERLGRGGALHPSPLLNTEDVLGTRQVKRVFVPCHLRTCWNEVDVHDEDGVVLMQVALVKTTPP